MYECFSCKKLDVFEDETYRIERKELITAARKSKARVAQAKNNEITSSDLDYWIKCTGLRLYITANN